MTTPPSDWQSSKGIARSILHDRTARRKAMARSLALLMIVFAIGLWGIDEWLAADLMRFVLWWGACGFLALFVVLFALYDAMRVIREERDRD
ncbi:hypothetical protein OKA04_16460 [Luteolibacter flavescens]|uniref:Uncharacterized protein n=1 Tax=Luteolibacter flavescens TaxID=1859460 RepID=A0ABT3FRX1_9BACT|nr:hypothetical protein [Luteolibacter flavescens]MCW1886332.1 hypothetical protein [Luteolibacter flavescens]